MCLGMHSEKGTRLQDEAHIQQSVKHILTTPIGTRLMRRDYGSILYDLIDQPNDASTRLRVMAAVVMALTRFEPRIQLLRVDFTSQGETLTVTLDAEHTDAPSPAFTFSVPLR